MVPEFKAPPLPPVTVLEFYPHHNSGLQFRPAPNVQLDFTIGLSLPADTQPRGMFTGCGFSMRY
jgi:hypothetical protein